jgi:hypothetical protein
LCADKLKGHEVNGIQCPHRNGNGYRARASTGPTISIIATRPIKTTHRIAMRILELLRVDTIPNLALKKPAGHKWLFPEFIRREPIFSQ